MKLIHHESISPFDFKIFLDDSDEYNHIFYVRPFRYCRLIIDLEEECKDDVSAFQHLEIIKDELLSKEVEYQLFIDNAGYDPRICDKDGNPLPDNKVWYKRPPTYNDLANYLGVSEQAVKQYDKTKRDLMIAGLRYCSVYGTLNPFRSLSL